MANKMRIGFLGTAYPYRGGIASFIHRLGEEFVSMGHEVEIITFTVQYPEMLFPGSSQYNDGPNPTDLPIVRKLNSAWPISWITTGRYMQSRRFDLIICKYWMPYFGPSYGTALRLAKRGNRTRVACIVDNIIPHERRFFDLPFSKYFAGSVDHFIVMSKAVQRDLVPFVRDQAVDFVRHPIYDNYGAIKKREQALASLGLDPSYRYILFFGFIRAYKGLDLLIEAMDDAYFAQEKIALLIAGEYYEDADQYKSLIEKLPDGVTVIEHDHFIADDRVPDYFCAADVVVQPYKSATQSGISQLAIYFEKPMIVTAVGGLKEIIGEEEAGYIVDASAVSIRSAIKRYYQEADQDKMIAYVRALKARFSWSTMTSVILDRHLSHHYE